MENSSEPHYSPEYLAEYNGDSVIVCASIFIVLHFIFVCLRFISRTMKRAPWGWDDAFIVAAAIFSYAVIAACLVDVYAGGVGYHVVAVAKNTPWKLETWAKFTFIIPLMYLPAIAMPKLSILCLYLRIFSEPIHRVVCWITAGLIVANCIGSMVPAFVICVPLEYLWNPKLPGGGHCIDIDAWYRWSSLMNILTDLIMLGLPVPVILKLHVSRNVKAGLAITFATGSIGVVTAIIRFVGFFTRDFAKDGTWTATRLIVLSIIEPGLYLIAACLVCLKPVVARVWDKSQLSSLLSKRTTTTSSFPQSRLDSHRMVKIESQSSDNDQSHRSRKTEDEERTIIMH